MTKQQGFGSHQIPERCLGKFLLHCLQAGRFSSSFPGGPVFQDSNPRQRPLNFFRSSALNPAAKQRVAVHFPQRTSRFLSRQKQLADFESLRVASQCTECIEKGAAILRPWWCQLAEHGEDGMYWSVFGQGYSNIRMQDVNYTDKSTISCQKKPIAMDTYRVLCFGFLHDVRWGSGERSRDSR